MTNFIDITSRKNEIVLRVASLQKSRARDELGLFVTEGIKLFLEAADAGFVPTEVFVTEDFIKSEAFEKFLSENKCPKLYRVTGSVYEKMTTESAPEGILCVFNKFSLDSTRDFLTILVENIQDPGNLGTILRSAAAFGAREVVAVSSCDVFSPKTVRATMGALFRIPYKTFDNISSAVSYVRERGAKVYAAALSPESKDFLEVDTSCACVMIGNEGHGLSPEALSLSDAQLIIPIKGVESLNASVAASIFLYDAMRKRNER